MTRPTSLPFLAIALLVSAGCLGAGGSKDKADPTSRSPTPSTTATPSTPPTTTSPPPTNETPPPPESTIQRVTLNLTGTTDAPDVFLISPDVVNATQGIPLNLTIRNADPAGTTGLNHSFTIPSLDIEVDALVPGANATIQFVPARVGAFDYYCAEPGHKELGMKGRLNVLPAAP